MQTSLVGKVAIVTGVSGDGQVGQAVARALAENGAQLAICARKQSNVEGAISPPRACQQNGSKYADYEFRGSALEA